MINRISAIAIVVTVAWFGTIGLAGSGSYLLAIVLAIVGIYGLAHTKEVIND